MIRRHSEKRILEDLVTKIPSPSTKAERNFHFAMLCVARVFPKGVPMWKQDIFAHAAEWGTRQPECPRHLRMRSKLEVYIEGKWSEMRALLPRYHNIVPCYVNNETFGQYVHGDTTLAQRQVDHDEKIIKGTVEAIDKFAKAVVVELPKVEGSTFQLRKKPIVLKSFADLKRR